MLDTKSYSTEIEFKIRDEIHPDMPLSNLVSSIWKAIQSVPTEKGWQTFLPGDELTAENGIIIQYNVYLAYRYDGFRKHVFLPPGIRVTYNKKEGNEHEVRFYSDVQIDVMLGSESMNTIADAVFAVCEDYFSQN